MDWDVGEHVCDYGHDGTVPAPVWTVEQERAAVVALLRAECGSPGHEDRYCAYCRVRRNIAADIERGEHRRKEKP
jgi:hypothetical protein